MKTLHFSIEINAPVNKVWDTMLNDETYRIWTKEFNPGGSYYEGSWDEGSKILFIGPGENGELGGMVSRIKENRKHEFVSIEHLGVFENGVEYVGDEKSKEWAGAMENYTFEDLGGKTKLTVDVDTIESYYDMMNDMWDKALEKLKELAEK